MALVLPTSADARRIRARLDKTIDVQLDLVRPPVLAWIGAGDHAVQTLRELLDRSGRPVTRAGKTTSDTHDKAIRTVLRTYREWVERGGHIVARLATQPQVARVWRDARNRPRTHPSAWRRSSMSSTTPAKSSWPR